MKRNDLEDDELEAGLLVVLGHPTGQQDVPQATARPLGAADGRHVVLGQTGHPSLVERRPTVACHLGRLPYVTVFIFHFEYRSWI